MKPPCFSVVGRGKSGKTTLIRHLIKEMRSRGYRLAVIKHDPKNHGEVDREGSDTSFFWEEGAQAVVLSSPSRVALFKRTEQECSPEQLVPLCGDNIDCVIFEGYKRMSLPKIEIWKEENKHLEINREQLLAIIYDKKDKNKVFKEYDGKGIPLIPGDEVSLIVDLLEESVIKVKGKNEKDK